MILKEIEVKKADGMQRNDAQTVVARAMRFSSSIFFEWKSAKVNVKSLMGVVAMGLKCGDKLMLIVNGEDQDEALEEIATLFENGFKL